MVNTAILIYTIALWLAYATASLSFDRSHLQRGHSIAPHPPFKPFPQTHPRTKTCKVKSHGDGSDDSHFILSALEKCNHGGRVVFSSDETYTIGAPLDLTFLDKVDIVIDGEIIFTNDTDYWQENSFKFDFQDSTTFFKLGGHDVNVYGDGEINGNGQAWYDLFASNKTILRPILIGIFGLEGGTIGPLKLRYSPMWYIWVSDSQDVIFDGIDITGFSNNKNTAKNTDGWDTYRSDNIVIQNSVINNGDDCVSFKPNSTNVLVQNLHCNGSHGISVGSLGQYIGVTDIVENVLVSNVAMSNASDGARIKVWPGADPTSTATDVGGGGGYVRNITYDGMTVSNVDYAIEITQCYMQKNFTACSLTTASLIIEDIWFKNFSGTTSSKYGEVVGTLVCSSPDVCNEIYAENISVVSTAGTDLYTCYNIDESELGLECEAP
ncbi:putative exopolygalacturonase X [Myxozyma melibiosi]|uniref:galacturonan 1,4-alpha-galacturonidase n=1 Tax=Myxozyma melibiosi TaxID=54550 RepID=A0ABR1F056_9ASCO